MTELITRSFQIREVNEETRTVVGLAVPYGQAIDLGGFKERFEPGAFDSAENVKLFYGHSEPIGKVVAGRDTEAGYEIEAVISKTTRGDEVYTLVKDDVLNRFSVGFMPLEERMDDDVVVRTKVDLKEVSIVPIPAYEGAVLSEVRQKDSEVRKDPDINEKEGHNMSEINSEVADLRDSVTELERRFAVLGETPAQQTTMYRSAGSWLKGLAAGESQARDFSVLADTDTKPMWLSDDLRLKVENRSVVNLFTKGPAPKSNVIAYRKIASTAGTVGVQATEGATLPYMEVTLTDGTPVNVKTYGGYISLSRQAIELSDVAFLDTEVRYAVNQYAKATNDAVLATFEAGEFSTVELASDTAANWIDVVVEAADYIKENSLGAEARFMVVAKDVYLRLAHMVDGSGRPLFSVSGQAVNALGAQNLTAGTLNVGGLTVVRESGLTTGTAYVAAPEAVTVWESAGAPFRLQDENIINLTKDFSLYGYMASAVTNEAAAVEIVASAG